MTEAQSEIRRHAAGRTRSRSSTKPSLLSARTTRLRRDNACGWSSTPTFSSALCSWKRHCRPNWRQGRFDLLTSAEQLDEIMHVTRYPKIRARLAPALAGRLINELRDIASVHEEPSHGHRLPGPVQDNYPLSMAVAGSADFLVTGDKRDLLGLKLHEGSEIVSVRDFLTFLQAVAMTTLQLDELRTGKDRFCHVSRRLQRAARAATFLHDADKHDAGVLEKVVASAGCWNVFLWL